MRISLYILVLCCLNQIRTQTHPPFLNVEFEKKLAGLLSHNVPEISCEALNKNFDEFILLDTREWNEYVVSHLKNAKWVGYNSFDSKLITKIPKSAKIVCYCSVGYRSERIAKKLMGAGYSNVYNLYGSIFEWINIGLPVYDLAGKEVRKVHGYNRKWSKWIFDKQYHVIF